MLHTRKLKIILQSSWFYFVLVLITLCYALFTTKIIKYDSKFNLNDSYLEGTIVDYNIDGNKLDLMVLGKERVKVTYYIKTEEEQKYLTENILVGSTIKAKGEFSEPLDNTIPNTFNYKKYLYNNRVYRIFKIDSYELSNKVNIFYTVKNWIIKRVNQHEILKPYLKTFVLGDKRSLELDEYANFQKNGISHLLAISGMHISLFSALISFVLNKLHLNKNKIFWITFSVLCFYGFLTSFPASIVRALVFMLFLNLNRIMEIKLGNTKCLMLCLCSIVFVNPFYLYDLGFLYSAITIFSILLCSNYIKGNYIAKTFKVSLIAFVFSMPITIYNFYEVNLLSPFINILFVPLVSFCVYPILLMCLIFPLLTPIGNLFINILELCNKVCGSLNIGLINIPKISLIIVFMLYFFLFAFVLTKRKMFVFLTIIILSFYKIYPLLNDNTFVYFLDVGQGDSSLMIMPYKREVLMIDTGGEVSFEQEEWAIKTRNYSKISNTITFLKSLGINKLDKLILTHGDYDHMGEAIKLVENFRVGKVIFNCGEFNNLEQNLKKVLDKQKIPYYSCVKELNINNNKLYFLNNKDYGDENNNSSVVYTELNNYKFLFMGDAGKIVEEDLIGKYNLQNIDVLKVGHHGSRTSSSEKFIAEIKPEYSIISVGKNNKYGHPNKSVLYNLNDSKVYRIDQVGSIKFKINNTKIGIDICSQ